MNSSRLDQSFYGSNLFSFNDNTDGDFKATLFEHSLPKKIKDNIQSNEVRFCREYLISISSSSMVVWRFKCTKRELLAGCYEFFLPSNSFSRSSNQGLVVFDDKTSLARHCLFVDNNGVVRFWPNIAKSDEYFDQKIPQINNTACLYVDQIFEDLLVFIFSNRKIVICDLKDYSDAGLIFKEFSQYSGIMGGISRCLTSLFSGNSGNNNNFKKIKVDPSKSEEMNIYVMFDSNIDNLNIDVLYNGSMSCNIIDKNLFKSDIFEKCYSTNNLNINEELTNLNILNFDLFCNIFYLLIEIFSLENNEIVDYILVAFNKKTEVIESCVIIDMKFEGNLELLVIEDDDIKEDDVCLLITVKDNHKIAVIEVLTGVVKSYLDLSPSNFKSKPSIRGWGLTKVAYDDESLLVALTTNLQLVTIRHSLPLFEKRIKVSDAKPAIRNNSELVAKTTKTISKCQGDVGNVFENDKQLLSKSNEMGDNLSETKYQESLSCVDKLTLESGTYGTFQKSLILYWMDYKSQSSRIMESIMELSEMDNDISVPLMFLRTVRELIEENPSKDPRWKRLIKPKAFVFSNKYLGLTQQINAKKEALHKLMCFYRDNNINRCKSCKNFIIAPLSLVDAFFLVKEDDYRLPIYDNSKEAPVLWSLMECIGFGWEFLEFSHVIVNLFTELDNDDMNDLARNACQFFLEKDKNLNSWNILSQKVCLIPKFLCQVLDYINRVIRSKFDTINFKTSSQQYLDIDSLCSVIIKSIYLGLRNSLNQRKEFHRLIDQMKLHEPPLPLILSSACWLTEESPLGVGDYIFDIILNVLDFAEYIGSGKLFNLTYDASAAYLHVFKNRLDWFVKHRINEDEFDRIKRMYFRDRHRIIGKIVEQAKHLEKALKLADQFEDFEWITSICEELDSQNSADSNLNLEKYLHKYRLISTAFAEFVLQWYRKKMSSIEMGVNKGRIMAKIQRILEKIQEHPSPAHNEALVASPLNSSSGSMMFVSRFLNNMDLQLTRWIHDIEMKDYYQASLSLMKLGQMEMNSIERKKRFFSLAKFCAITYLKQTKPDNSSVELKDICSKELELIQFQESLPDEEIEKSLAFDKTQEKCNQPIILLPQLVRLYLKLGKENSDVKWIVQLFELLNFILNNINIGTRPSDLWLNRADISHVAIDDLLYEVWSQIVLLDDWLDPTNKFDAILESSWVAKVIREALVKRVAIERVLPDLDRLLEHRNLEIMSDSPDSHYRIRKTFESLNNEINEVLNGNVDINGVSNINKCGLDSQEMMIIN